MKMMSSGKGVKANRKTRKGITQRLFALLASLDTIANFFPYLDPST